MNIGNMQEFQQKQLSKVEQRKEEDKKIKKGIYQMQVMIDSQCMETLTKECDKSGNRNAGMKDENKNTEIKQRENKRTDIHTELEKMLAMAGKNVSLNQKNGE